MSVSDGMSRGGAELAAEVRVFLRLGSTDTAALTTSIDAPPALPNQGLAESPAIDRLEGFVDVALGADVGPELVRVRRGAREAIVEAGDVRLAFSGDARPLVVDAPEGIVLDPAWVVPTSSAIVHVVGDRTELALSFAAGRISVHRIVRAEEAPLVDAPDIDAIVNRDACEPWLLEAARALGDRHAGAGLVARLWSPPRGGAHAFVQAMTTGAIRHPASIVRDWAQSLPLRTLDAIERACAPRIVALRALLEAIDAIVAADPDGEDAAARVLAMSHARDDLESSAFVLRAAGRGAVLDARLAQLDRDAAARLSALGWAAGAAAEDERIAAVAWQEPLAWWGRLGD